VKGSRIRKPVIPPATVKELTLEEIWAVLRKVQLGRLCQCVSSVQVVEFLTQVSVKQNRSGWLETMRSDKAAEWSGWRMERMLRVHKVKLVGPRLSSMSPERKRQARRKGLHRHRGRRWAAM